MDSRWIYNRKRTPWQKRVRKGLIAPWPVKTWTSNRSNSKATPFQNSTSKLGPNLGLLSSLTLWSIVLTSMMSKSWLLSPTKSPKFLFTKTCSYPKMSLSLQLKSLILSPFLMKFWLKLFNSVVKMRDQLQFWAQRELPRCWEWLLTNQRWLKWRSPRTKCRHNTR